MTELKTLKDIDLGICEGHFVVLENLKQEAIKWVKYDLNRIDMFLLPEEDLKQQETKDE
jgi:hypothetical protein